MNGSNGAAIQIINYDPSSVGLAVAAPCLAMRMNGAVTELWLKTGPAPTAWTQVTSGGGGTISTKAPISGDGSVGDQVTMENTVALTVASLHTTGAVIADGISTFNDDVNVTGQLGANGLAAIDSVSASRLLYNQNFPFLRNVTITSGAGTIVTGGACGALILDISDNTDQIVTTLDMGFAAPLNMIVHVGNINTSGQITFAAGGTSAGTAYKFLGDGVIQNRCGGFLWRTTAGGNPAWHVFGNVRAAV